MFVQTATSMYLTQSIDKLAYQSGGHFFVTQANNNSLLSKSKHHGITYLGPQVSKLDVIVFFRLFEDELITAKSHFIVRLFK